VKCISLWQPWASAIALGLKRVETRGWGTNHRGALLIHAAITDRGICAASQPLLSQVVQRSGLVSPARLPFGAIVAQVELIDCVPMTAELIEQQSEAELLAGEWAVGRFAWLLANVTSFPAPIPYRGRQGLFEVDAGTVLP
jgi:hypothetical protein